MASEELRRTLNKKENDSGNPAFSQRQSKPFKAIMACGPRQQLARTSKKDPKIKLITGEGQHARRGAIGVKFPGQTYERVIRKIPWFSSEQ